MLIKKSQTPLNKANLREKIDESRFDVSHLTCFIVPFVPLDVILRKHCLNEIYASW